MAEWTITSEILQLTGCGSIAESLAYLSLIDSQQSRFEIATTREWYRAGAETYIYEFAVISEGLRKQLVLKACTPTLGPNSPDVILDAWIARRSLLAACHVKVPKLYGWKGAILLEEHVPYDLRAFVSARINTPAFILPDICQIAAALIHLEFSPVAPYSDLRTDGERLYVIDFGSDIGPPRQASSSFDLVTNMTTRYINSLSVDDSYPIRQEIRRCIKSMK